MVQQSEGGDVTTTITYPDNGPRDIFDLSAPRTAEFIDLRPKGDLKLILETLRMNRTTMDPYQAIVFDGWIHRIWRRYPEWRIEQVRKLPPRTDIPEGTDAIAWWNEYVQDADVSIEAIGDGTREVTFRAIRDRQPDPNNPGFIAIKGYEKSVQPFGRLDADRRAPSNHHLFPEFVGYPVVGDSPVLFDLATEQGPQGTIGIEEILGRNDLCLHFGKMGKKTAQLARPIVGLLHT